MLVFWKVPHLCTLCWMAKDRFYLSHPPKERSRITSTRVYGARLRTNRQKIQESGDRQIDHDSKARGFMEVPWNKATSIQVIRPNVSKKPMVTCWPRFSAASLPSLRFLSTTDSSTAGLCWSRSRTTEQLPSGKLR